MAKLIVEEGGARRAFRMGKGVLTVGSGAEARLRLSSTEVAEIHLELELGEQGVTLRPRPGVVPPRVGGLPAKGELLLAPGKKVELGGARLWVEDESSPSAPASRPAAAPAAAPRPARAARKERAPSASREARRGASPARPRRAGKPWLVPVVVLAATALAFLVWSTLVKKGAGGEGLAQNKLRAAEQAAAVGKFEEAGRELSGIPAGALTPEQEARLAKVLEEVRQAESNAELHFANASGTRYLDTLLKKYEGIYLQGTPDQAKVRLFLKRCKTFRARWPQHPEMDWVERQERRFAGYVDMNAPPTWEDVQWEVKDLTDGMPRNYAAALALLDELLTRVAGEERTKAQNLRDELVRGRAEYATDRIYQAKHEFEKKGDASKAVWWLVHNIAWLGDEALANESARLLEKMPDVAGHMLGYKKNYPDRYEAVMRNPVMRAWAEAAGFTP